MNIQFGSNGSFQLPVYCALQIASLNLIEYIIL